MSSNIFQNELDHGQGPFGYSLFVQEDLRNNNRWAGGPPIDGNL